jgi:hypothetical protein
MEKQFTITKSTVECYKIRHESAMYWADITIDANGTTGRIQIASDYGSWQNYWGACGKSFKEFLCGLDKHYVAGKFGAGQWFDLEKTIRHFKRNILEYRRGEELSAEKARQIWDELKQNFDSNLSGFLQQLENNCEYTMNHFDWSPDLIYGIDPSFEKFWNELWPVFINTIREEL